MESTKLFRDKESGANYPISSCEVRGSNRQSSIVYCIVHRQSFIVYCQFMLSSELSVSCFAEGPEPCARPSRASWSPPPRSAQTPGPPSEGFTCSTHTCCGREGGGKSARGGGRHLDRNQVLRRIRRSLDGHFGDQLRVARREEV